jgi:hypothetical protein
MKHYLCEVDDNDLSQFASIFNDTYYRECDIISFLDIDEYLYRNILISLTAERNIRVSSDGKLFCSKCKKFKYPSEFLTIYNKECFYCMKENK